MSILVYLTRTYSLVKQKRNKQLNKKTWRHKKSSFPHITKVRIDPALPQNHFSWCRVFLIAGGTQGWTISVIIDVPARRRRVSKPFWQATLDVRSTSKVLGLSGAPYGLESHIVFWLWHKKPRGGGNPSNGGGWWCKEEEKVENGHQKEWASRHLKRLLLWLWWINCIQGFVDEGLK